MIITLPVTVGNVLTTDAMVTGTVAPLMVAVTELPGPVLFALANAWVTIAGTLLGAAVAAVSVTCPSAGAGTRVGPPALYV
jgi:biotin transporter BioY